MYHERIAIIDGVRTPFVKAGTKLRHYSMQQLGVHVLRALVKRANLDPKTIDEFVFSTVLLDPRMPNWAREILFAAGLPKSIYAYSVSNNCISGLVAITSLAESIALGRVNCGIAGGSESMSNPTLLFRQQSAQLFLSLARAKSLPQKLRLLGKFRPKHLFPAPVGVTEPSTGLTMGEHMEISAKEWKISRLEQDEIALRSHQNAHQGAEYLTREIEPVDGVTHDLLIRSDTSMAKLTKLSPVFDISGNGTITAGNSSALTDGASAVLLMSESRTKKEGREALAFLTHYEYSAISPADGLLMAPAVAVPRLLRRLGLTINDFDRIEIHEAFGAQVAANIKAWGQGWKESSIGQVDNARLNILGGSIAIGHPFAATGGRIITTLANELKRHGLKRGLVSICAAGAMAGTVILERDD